MVWITLIIVLFLILLVIYITMIKKSSSEKNVTLKEIDITDPASKWKCPNCGQLNYENFCCECGSKRM